MTAATNVVVVNSTTITATTPAGSAGAVTVTVTNIGSQSGSLANGFTYNAPVAIGFRAGSLGHAASADSDGEREPIRRRRRLGDLNVVVVGWNDTDLDGAVGEGQRGEHLQSGHRADERDGDCGNRSTMRRTSRAAATR